MKKIFPLLSALALWAALLCGCGGAESGPAPESTGISLSPEGCSIRGGGAAEKNGEIRISAGGSYELSGSYSGTVRVNTADSPADVIIILNNAEINNPEGPAIYIEQAENTRIRLAPGSMNTLTSGASGQAADENASGAVIYSEDDLDIEGEGRLEIQGNINNGIGCKDDLDINGGDISISALNNGVRASESLDIKGGRLSVEAGNDGLKTSSARKEGKGGICISAGEITVTSGGDAVSAESGIIIEGGSLELSAGGDPEQLSSSALKAKAGISISGGSINAAALDDALSCMDFSMDGGSLSLSSQLKRGIDAEGGLSLKGGTVSISSADDGIRTLEDVSLSGGSLSISSCADGIQAGDRKSGELRSFSQSGGELYICAGKQALKPGELSLSSGSLMALQAEEESLIGGEGILRASVTVTEGQSLSLGGRSMECSRGGRLFLCFGFEPDTPLRCGDREYILN